MVKKFGNKTADDYLRERAAALGDGDYWLSRSDATVVCQAISLTLPIHSWQGVKSRICSVLCRFSRLGDRWMIASDLDPCEKPGDVLVSIKALKLLRARVSGAVFEQMRSEAEISKSMRKEASGEAPEIVVEALYSVLARGRNADKLRDRIRREERVRADEQRVRADQVSLAREQRKVLDNHALD
ncbi:hypothetical protein [Pandoraea sp. ISTKB]|uniref:hypothetical protein n=1 Tax=Pandoraea sp. ISTKB TaxID=1586708 RepID=UPI001112E1B5|nr:hypothetical protein [Pandoraea sp. ISTKB]